jgi:hypothetical protein
MLPPSRSGVYNLFNPPRRNAQSSACRSVLDVKVGKVVNRERKHHPRAKYSGHRMKTAEQFVALLHKTGLGSAEEFHVDGMCKTPIWIPARRAGRVSFLVKGPEGAEIENADHSFPLDTRMLLGLSGVSRCGDLGKAVLHPVEMSAYIRPVRYFPISTATNLGDLDDAISHWCGLPNERQQPDVILIGSDNGSDYQMESPLVIHAMGRLFRLPRYF